MRGPGSRCVPSAFPLILDVTVTALQIIIELAAGLIYWLLGQLQVQIKKDNGKTIMVPAFQSLETIAGEVAVVTVLFLFALCLLWCA